MILGLVFELLVVCKQLNTIDPESLNHCLSSLCLLMFKAHCLGHKITLQKFLVQLMI